MLISILVQFIVQLYSIISSFINVLAEWHFPMSLRTSALLAPVKQLIAEAAISLYLVFIQDMSYSGYEIFAEINCLCSYCFLPRSLLFSSLPLQNLSFKGLSKSHELLPLINYLLILIVQSIFSQHDHSHSIIS